MCGLVVHSSETAAGPKSCP